jgi:hypothetical protein
MKVDFTAVELTDLKLILDREIEEAFLAQAKYLKAVGKFSKAHEARVATARKLLAKLPI